MAEDVNKKKTISHTLGIVHINRLLDIQVALWIGNDSHNVKVINFFLSCLLKKPWRGGFVMVLVTLLLTYCPVRPSVLGAATKLLHSCLSCAFLSMTPQLQFRVFSSVSTVPLEVRNMKVPKSSVLFRPLFHAAENSGYFGRIQLQ